MAINKQYDGQAHHMSKAAQSLVNLLNGLDYSAFEPLEATRFTASFHSAIRQIEFAQDTRTVQTECNCLDGKCAWCRAQGHSETYPVTRPDGRVVNVTVPEREDN